MGASVGLFNQSCSTSTEMKLLALASTVVAAVSGQYFQPYGLLGLKSAPCVNAANVPVPCAGYHYGKREADPAYFYTGYQAAVPFGSSTGLDPYTQGLDAVTQGLALPYSYYGKRDAEAEPEANAYYGVYGYHGLGYRSYYGHPYAHRGYYYGKRSAEADPVVVAGYSPYPAVYAAPHGVVAPHAGLVHSSHAGLCVNYLGAQVPC